MYKAQNGWTKESMKARIRERNNGTKSLGVLDREDYASQESCAYRGKNGNACAAGCFIEDSEYSPVFEGKFASSLIQHYGLKMPLSGDGMDEMQRIHDCCLADVHLHDSLFKWIDKNVED